MGRKVVLQGLSSRKDLNNSQGTCVQYKSDKQRFVVRLDGSNNSVAVPLACVRAVDPPLSVLTSLRSCVSHNDGRSFQFGRTLLPGDFVSMFVEWCRLEAQKKTVGSCFCAVCGKGGAVVTCAGCGLCHWCDNGICQRHGIQGGHGLLCQQLRALREIYEHDDLQQACKLFHSDQFERGNAMMYEVSRSLSRGLDSQAAKVILTCCNAAIKWPASSEMAVCRPGTKYRLNEAQMMELEFGGVQANKAIPGKLTFCATSHKKAYKELSKKELKQKHVLPCGKDPVAGRTKGVTGNLMHPPIEATLEDLSLRKFQQTLCESCNSQPDLMGGKIILSDVFYSYCLGRVCNSNGLPGSVAHCPSCMWLVQELYVWSLHALSERQLRWSFQCRSVYALPRPSDYA